MVGQGFSCVHSFLHASVQPCSLRIDASAAGCVSGPLPCEYLLHRWLKDAQVSGTEQLLKDLRLGHFLSSAVRNFSHEGMYVPQPLHHASTNIWAGCQWNRTLNLWEPTGTPRKLYIIGDVLLTGKKQIKVPSEVVQDVISEHWCIRFGPTLEKKKIGSRRMCGACNREQGG